MKATLIDLTLVGSGGFIGAVCRYSLSGWIHRHFPASTFPWGTLTVNLLGCLAIGALIGVVEVRQLLGPESRRFALIGLLGSFTTYSTFGYEAFAMLRGAEYVRGVGYVGAHLLIGLACVAVGYAVAVGR